MHYASDAEEHGMASTAYGHRKDLRQHPRTCLRLNEAFVVAQMTLPKQQLGRAFLVQLVPRRMRPLVSFSRSAGGAPSE